MGLASFVAMVVADFVELLPSDAGDSVPTATDLGSAIGSGRIEQRSHGFAMTFPED